MSNNGKPKEVNEFIVIAQPEDNFRYASIFAEDETGRTFFIPVYDGQRYKEVYGISRNLRNPEKPDKVLFEAYEVQGVFDAERVKWKEADMKVRNMETKREESIKVKDWSFSVYEGDELYLIGPNKEEKRIFSSK
jgi:hypothetical protein